MFTLIMIALIFIIALGVAIYENELDTEFKELDLKEKELNQKIDEIIRNIKN